MIQSSESAFEPTISVIIPSYNSASTLPDAIDSVLNQTVTVDEIIVVDDGSTDDTESVCRRYANVVNYVRQDNAGASTARNTGAEASNGQWLAFLDADDTWDPEKIEQQIAALRENPEADFVVTAALVWSPREQAHFKYEWTGCLDPCKLRRELLIRNIFTGICSSILVRREAFETVGGFADGKGCEDRRIAIDLLARHRALILPQALIRQRPGPASFSNPEIWRREMLGMISDYLPLFHQLDRSGRLLRRARARVYERTGMHYLENGDLPTAARELAQAAVLWPFMANPWRFFINACLGRLRKPARRAAAV